MNLDEFYKLFRKSIFKISLINTLQTLKKDTSNTQTVVYKNVDIDD